MCRANRSASRTSTTAYQRRHDDNTDDAATAAAAAAAANQAVMFGFVIPTLLVPGAATGSAFTGHTHAAAAVCDAGVLPARHAAASAASSSLSMVVQVRVNQGEPIESALRRFKKEVSKSGHLFELRRRRYFETNTEKRLRKETQSKRRARQTTARNQ